MSGHSHWATIKRKKGAGDAKRGQLFTKLAKEIVLAARDGGDPDTNFKLRLAIDKARSNNMPKDSIDRAIKRGTGESKDGAVFEEIMYEGYGPKGVALMIECVTENRNRTVADIQCFQPVVLNHQHPHLGVVTQIQLRQCVADGADVVQLWIVAHVQFRDPAPGAEKLLQIRHVAQIQFAHRVAGHCQLFQF